MIQKFKNIASVWPIFLIAFFAWYSYIIWLEKRPSEIELSNSIEAKDVLVSPRVSGKIKEIFIDEGYTVKKGQILLKIEADELNAQLDQAKSSYSQAVYDLLDLKKGARYQEKAQAYLSVNEIKTQLDEAKLNLDNRKNEYIRMKALYDDGAISKNNYEKYELAYRTTQKNVTLLEESYKKSMANESLVFEGPRIDQIRSREANTKKISGQIKELQTYVNELTIVSPIDGEISSFDMEVGEIVSANKPILTITDLSDMFVRIYIPVTELSKMTINKILNLKVDSFPNETFKGKVVYIGANAIFTPRNIQTPEERTKLVYPVRVKIDNANKKLRDGMYVTVKI